MLSLTKIFQASKFFLQPRLAASVSCHGAKFITNKAVTIEERLGLPRRPKKPLTPYFRFLSENREKLSKDNPNKKTIDIVRMMAKQWAVLEDAKKHQWDQQYQADKQAYIEDCIKYDSKLTEEQRNDIYEAKERRNDQKEKLALRKKTREHNKPKKPASGFLRFTKDVTYNKDKETFREFQLRAVEKWNALTFEQKEVYNEACRAENAAYKQEIAKWELKMVRLGNVDLVRASALIEAPEVKKLRKTTGRPPTRHE